MGVLSFFLCNLSWFTQESHIKFKCEPLSSKQSNERGREMGGEAEALQNRWGTINNEISLGDSGRGGNLQ